MDPIIEILTKNIMNNNKYNEKLKKEFIFTINRIYAVRPNLEQMYRSMDYILLYSNLNDEILFLVKQQKYFNLYLEDNVNQVLDDFLENIIRSYNHLMNSL
jgi:hypothetical protein